MQAYWMTPFFKKKSRFFYYQNKIVYVKYKSSA